MKVFFKKLMMFEKFKLFKDHIIDIMKISYYKKMKKCYFLQYKIPSTCLMLMGLFLLSEFY